MLFNVYKYYFDAYFHFVDAYFSSPRVFFSTSAYFFHVRLLMQISSAISTIRRTLLRPDNQCACESRLLQIELDLHVPMA